MGGFVLLAPPFLLPPQLSDTISTLVTLNCFPALSLEPVPPPVEAAFEEPPSQLP